ncbi:hypothetical protein T492DRAFT_856936 [Pavlovales sp. CCMP2436]|nr:hypothetical protein T492DRAFT_856936 [Pavlovales sp. CCMP2436]
MLRQAAATVGRRCTGWPVPRLAAASGPRRGIVTVRPHGKAEGDTPRGAATRGNHARPGQGRRTDADRARSAGLEAQRRARELRASILPPTQTGYTFADFASSGYSLSETSKQVCLLNAFLHLQPNDVPAIGWRQRWLLLEGVFGSELKQERLVRALAHELGASFLLLRMGGLAAASLPEGRGGAAASSGGAKGQLGSRKVAQIAREIEDLTDELGELVHEHALTKCDKMVNSVLADALCAQQAADLT